MLCRATVSVCQPVLNLKMLLLGLVFSVFAYALIHFSVCEDLRIEALKHSNSKNDYDVRYVEINRTKRKDSTQLKYVLLWTQKRNTLPFPPFKIGQTSFIQNKCPQVDCFFTKDRRFFGGSLEKFDAILFNGIHLDERSLPKTRYDHQKYIYVNIESADNYPVCLSVYDNYFNWTYTYKLNSDLLIRYFEITNKENKVVGPHLTLEWIKTNINNRTLNAVKKRWQKKSRAVVWMVSNCRALNRREKFVQQLQKSFYYANLSLDIYGDCGDLSCSRGLGSECWKLFEWKHYFYLSFENSNSEDYVTEKVLYPLERYVIPIVYGGANYSRFLPHGSYVDASNISPDELVAKMIKIMSSLVEYSEYFKWRSEYKYRDATRNNICSLCSALHNRTMMDTRKSYKKFREWWLPRYRHNCRNKLCLRC